MRACFSLFDASCLESFVCSKPPLRCLRNEADEEMLRLTHTGINAAANISEFSCPLGSCCFLAGRLSVCQSISGSLNFFKNSFQGKPPFPVSSDWLPVGERSLPVGSEVADPKVASRSDLAVALSHVTCMLRCREEGRSNMDTHPGRSAGEILKLKFWFVSCWDEGEGRRSEH